MPNKLTIINALWRFNSFFCDNGKRFIILRLLQRSHDAIVIRGARLIANTKVLDHPVEERGSDRDGYLLNMPGISQSWSDLCLLLLYSPDPALNTDRPHIRAREQHRGVPSHSRRRR